ncbi:MAG: glycosyltransferase [Acidobacteria bacterium]|nr:glycosyltransferase [Acidobacteriota bacterium]
MKTLYICYFGLREPLVQTQVLPYLRHLSKVGIGVSLLTFEPNKRDAWSAQAVSEWEARLQTDGIQWFSLPYHKRPSIPATLYDIMAGARTAARLMRQHGIHVLHARSHVPMAMALMARRMVRCRLVFDIRGLMAEEYADAGIWSENSLPFRVMKRLERAGIRKSDQVVVLTQKMRRWLIERGLAGANKIEVIPCCVDFSRFTDEHIEGNGKSSGRFEMVYAGSVTGLYLFEEMGRFFLALRAAQPDAFFRVLTNSSAADAADVLQRVGLDDKDFWIGAVPPEEVPRHLRQARLGLSFRKPTFSQIAASPTKIPEYLAAGLPVVSNYGIGDADDLLEKEKVGVIMRAFNDQEYARVVKEALSLLRDLEIQTRCMAVAREHFDLVNVGGEGYHRVYNRVEEKAAMTNP